MIGKAILAMIGISHVLGSELKQRHLFTQSPSEPARTRSLSRSTACMSKGPGSSTRVVMPFIFTVLIDLEPNISALTTS